MKRQRKKEESNITFHLDSFDGSLLFFRWRRLICVGRTLSLKGSFSGEECVNCVCVNVCEGVKLSSVLNLGAHIRKFPTKDWP